MITIIIPTVADKIKTLDSLRDAPPHRLIISRAFGVAKARNWGAHQITSNVLMVFLDDDLVLSSRIWEFISQIKEGQCGMVQTETTSFPCSRVMAIRKHDFWRCGCFDEKIRFAGEDLDFYLRNSHDLSFVRIPSLFYHEPHERKRRKYHLERGYLFLKHGYNYLSGDLVIRNYLRRPIKFMLLVMGFFYHAFRRLVSYGFRRRMR